MIPATMTGGPKKPKPWDGDDPYIRAGRFLAPFLPPLALLALLTLAGLARFPTP